MHTRSAKDKITGKFTVEVWDWNGLLWATGEFDSCVDADQFAQSEERKMTLVMTAPKGELLTLDELLMSDDELLTVLEV